MASSPEMALFRSLLSNRSGIDFGQHRELLLESRARRRMRARGARSLYEYYRMVTAAGDGARELEALMDEVSIHETSFFRNPPQFELLQDMALPQRVSARLGAGERRLFVWSAGSSTGQEPYSIAIAVAESLVLSDAWDLRLVATDVSRQALAQAREGRYTSAQMGGISPERRRRFFERKQDCFLIRPWLRRGFTFHHASVLAGAPLQDIDVVFCRNLMIYFDREGQRRLLTVLTGALAPGGYLFLGHAETLGALASRFRMVAAGRGIAYQKLP